MGSYLSCASLYIFPSDTVKVIHFNGSFQEFQTQIKAAELMLENPQHFVCHSDSLQLHRRINPLPADEDLEAGHLYFILPMSKLQSVLSGSDMASIGCQANSAAKRSSKNGVNIISLLGGLWPLTRGQGTYLHHTLLQENYRLDRNSHEKTNDSEIVMMPKMDTGSLELEIDLGKYKSSRCRSWKPNLETIREAERLTA